MLRVPLHHNKQSWQNSLQICFQSIQLSQQKKLRLRRVCWLYPAQRAQAQHCWNCWNCEKMPPTLLPERKQRYWKSPVRHDDPICLPILNVSKQERAYLSLIICCTLTGIQPIWKDTFWESTILDHGGRFQHFAPAELNPFVVNDPSDAWMPLKRLNAGWFNLLQWISSRHLLRLLSADLMIISWKTHRSEIQHVHCLSLKGSFMYASWNVDNLRRSFSERAQLQSLAFGLAQKLVVMAMKSSFSTASRLTCVISS